MKLPTLAILVLLAAGCVPSGREVTAPSAGRPADAQPAQTTVIALQIYEVAVPRGRISDDVPLWFGLDERATGVATYDVLWANGFRVGVGGAGELDAIREALRAEQAVRAQVVPPLGATRHTYYADRPPAGEQTLFWFDERKRSHGRTFADVQNRLAIEFAPGRDDTVRLTITPVVRSAVGRTRVTATGEDYVVEEVRDEAAFDLDARLTLPLGGFALVAPSPDADRATSLGHAFLTSGDAAPRTETALLIVPQRVGLRQLRGSR